MPVKIIPNTIKTNEFSFNSLLFKPEKINEQGLWAIFTHGYTASKSDCINWAHRLSDLGVPSIIFDQPGHRLGSFNTVRSFEVYQQKAHTLFINALNCLKEALKESPKKIVIGGHSLGAMLALKALSLDELAPYNPMAIGVGIGISQHKSTHLFESDFYQKTLNVRRQLVEPELDSDLIFPWIKEEKESIDIADKRIHLITGSDDVVVGEGGMQALIETLQELKNEVTFKEPKKLPHHEPSMAATYINSFLKKEFNL